MNLIIDIGNTRAKLVAFEGDEIVEQAYSDSNTLCALDAFTGRYHFEKGILSTVVHIGHEAEERLNKLAFPLTRLSNETRLPIDLRWRIPGTQDCIPMPPTMGADRIAAIVGAMCQMPDTPLLVIDAGTCVTYEVVDDEGFYAGGNIAPGLLMRLKAMHEHTALLPLVEADGETPLLGHDTETCMRSGAALGLKYEIEGYIREWKARFPSLHVFVTGGDVISFSQDLHTFLHRDNYLVPKGLNHILCQGQA